MPLYSDSSNYFYSGGSTPLFSPYYPGSSSSLTTSTYSPYTSTYNRTLPGSYVVPITPSRSPSYSTHALSSTSRYQPKLSTITESSPLMSVSRHTTLMPLTRINSPKYTSYSSSSTPIHTPKYTPPKPILINTADIDVSANRYRKRKEEAMKAVQREHELQMANLTNALTNRESQDEEKKPQRTNLYDPQADRGELEGPERNRSTIKRNRAVVRLSTIRSRSKDRNRQKFENLYTDDEPDGKKAKEPSTAATGEQFTDSKLPNLTDDLTPNPLEEVILELDPKDNSVRRLSIPQCPTFHDICEDISSDKIDDDLNAGALRRRASIIQIQEQQLLNQLQKSPSGSLQTIHLERRDSHDSSDGSMAPQTALKRHSKRLSKKGNKIRHRITAIVEVENDPSAFLVLERNEKQQKSPKFTVNVESVEEHHEIHKVFKLPKKKSVKKSSAAAKNKEPHQLPEGFMTPLPKPQTSPKKKMVEKKPTYETKAEIFTFDEAAVEAAKVQEEALKEDVNVMKSPTEEEIKTPKENLKKSVEEEIKTPSKISKIGTKKEESPTKGISKPTKAKSDSPKTPKSLVINKDTLDEHHKEVTPSAAKITESKDDSAEQFNSFTIKLKTPKKPVSKEETLTEPSFSRPDENEPRSTAKTLKHSQSLDSGPKPATGQKTLEKSNSITVELETPATPKTPLQEKSKISEPLKTSQSLGNVSAKPGSAKTLEKSNSINVELKTSAPSTSKTPQTPLQETIPEEPLVATPKPIRKVMKKSDSGEDFWAQIGTRETLYMDKRKHELLDSLWQKREDFLESTTSDAVKNLEEIKTAVSEQKVEALKQAEEAERSSKSTVERSNSNDSALNKEDLKKIENKLEKTTAGVKKEPKEAEKKDASAVSKLKDEEKKEVKKISPIKKNVTSPKPLDSPKPPGTPIAKKRLNLGEANKESPQINKIMTANSSGSPKSPETPVEKKPINLDSPLNNKLALDKNEPKSLSSAAKLAEAKIPDSLDSKEVKISATLATEAKAKTSAGAITTTTTTTPTKIYGHPAKSPERQEPEESTAKQTTQAKGNYKNNNKQEKALDINKTLASPTTATATTTTKTNDQQQLPETELLAKPLTATKDNNINNNKITVKSSAEALPTPGITTKQPETKAVTAELKTNAALTTPTDSEAKPTKKKTPTKTKAPTPPKTKAKQSPKNVINADQFIAKAPAKASNASPPAKQTKTTAAAVSGSPTTKKTPDAKKKTTNSAANVAATTSPKKSSAAAATTTTTTGIASRSGHEEIRKEIGNKTTNGSEDVVNNNDVHHHQAGGTCGGNLSKFATVSNLAQCLQDVDADLDDYIASSAENSEDETYTDDSDFDYSSIDGWDKFTPSMKKKIKQRHRKEKQAEQARFDPHKKVKIDTTRKLYVKEEAPRYPLVATPRPLWKRDKVVYPVDDSDDSDESEESGSTEETEESDECSTSEEYEDELNPAAASGAVGGDPNIIRMSTCSNDSGFEGGTAPSSPKKMLETSYTYSQFQKSGRFTPPATIIPRFKNYSVDDFHFLAVLGKGSFGKVLLAELRDTTYYYAVKCLKKDVVLEDDDVDSTLIERKVLALGTKHPYLCHLFCTFQTESHLFFVMEYLNGGDLMFHIQESGRFTEERARFYGAEIISGLKFLHKKGIIYRDLKLDNVLLDYEGHVRIADFGMCKLQIYLDKTADSFCGTPDYMAPEIIKGESYNQNVDWWSFGVLLYEMLIGQSPFSGCDEDELFWSICNEIPWFPVYITEEATSILKGLLEKDHDKRIGNQYSPAGDVVEHVFFRPIDWNLLEKRLIEPPCRPQVKHPLDTQYFDRVFTRERVRLTPIDKDILQSMDQKQFLGFTYTNPHITLD
uniref:Protein kinase C n=1 Tax=Stomoxys calcitrans TaxID=35570 RepID=A0A1I8NYG9_STOCA